MKTVLLFLSLGFTAASCNPAGSSDSANAQQPSAENIRQFWHWFSQNTSQFADLHTQKDEKLTLLEARLHAIQPALGFELSAKPNAQGRREIIISAEGDTSLFPLVKQIIAQAPPIRGWQPIAFRQPANEDFTITFQDLSLTPSALYFEPVLTHDTLDVIIYGKGFAKHAPNTLSTYGLIMLDNMLGEYAAATQVRYYDFQDLAKAPDTLALKPLPQLSSLLRERSKAARR